MFKWLRRFILVTVAVVLLWILRAYPLRAIGEFLVVQDEPRAAQAIVLLAGESPSRALGAYDLYKQGLSPRILLTRGHRTQAEEMLLRRNIPFTSGADVDRQILIKLGVPEDKVQLLPDDVTDTFNEAEAIRAYLKGHSVRQILLVTSRYHSRRAKMAFEHVFRGTVEFISAPTLYDEYDAHNWWHKRVNVRELIIEYQKLAFYTAVLFWDFLGEVRSFPEQAKEGKAI